MRHRSAPWSFAVLAALSAAWGTGCREQAAAPKQVARFEGYADPISGTLQFRVLPEDGAPRLASVEQEIPADPRGNGVGTGLADTVELVTDWVSYTDLAYQTTSAGSGARPCGKPGSFCAQVTLRSLFATEELHHVYVDITTLSPQSGYEGFSKSADPGGLGLNSQYGLWSYPALLDSTRGAVGGAAPGANAASAVWYFDNLSDTAFTFTGRIMADPVPTTASGYNATCGGEETPLTSAGNCGECGRHTATDICVYTGNGAGTQGAAELAYDFCGNGRTACDTRAANFYDCVDLAADVGNCGACGHSCGAGNACSDGQCVAGSSACGAVQCPLGTTCSAGTCLLSSATEVSVGGDFACATTSVARPQQPSPWVANPTYESNVVCWGDVHLRDTEANGGYPADRTWSRAQTFLDYLEPPDNVDHTNALWPDMHALACGGLRCVALTNFALTSHPRAAYFFGRNWNYVEGVQTIALKLSLGIAHGVAFYPNIGTPNFHVLVWGDTNTHGQIGFGPVGTGSVGYPQQVLPAIGHEAGFNQYVGPFLTASDVAAGGNTSCAVLQADDAAQQDGPGQTAGTVACWGQNDSGQASGVAGADVTAPALVAGVSNATAISVGLRHTVALTGGGHLLFWGDDSSGQFGVAKSGAITEVVPAQPVESFTAGADVTCYESGGTVYCAGRNDRGQLGQGDAAVHSGFVAVPGLSSVTAVHASTTSAAGAGTVCAVTASGTVWCWGDNTSGQLGIGTTGGYSTSPVQVTMEPL